MSERALCMCPTNRDHPTDYIPCPSHDETDSPRAAVGLGWETQERSRVPWADVPEANKETMRATLRAVMPVHDELVRADERKRLAGEVEALADIRTAAHHPTAAEWCSCHWTPDPVPLMPDGSGDHEAMEEMARQHRARVWSGVRVTEEE